MDDSLTYPNPVRDCAMVRFGSDRFDEKLHDRTEDLCMKIVGKACMGHMELVVIWNHHACVHRIQLHHSKTVSIKVAGVQNICYINLMGLANVPTHNMVILPGRPLPVPYTPSPLIFSRKAPDLTNPALKVLLS